MRISKVIHEDLIILYFVVCAFEEEIGHLRDSTIDAIFCVSEILFEANDNLRLNSLDKQGVIELVYN